MFRKLHDSNRMDNVDKQFKVKVSVTVTHLGDEEYHND
jgi:hypothetical protein